jgi:hypothetical protein
MFRTTPPAGAFYLIADNAGQARQKPFPCAKHFALARVSMRALGMLARDHRPGDFRKRHGTMESFRRLAALMRKER